MSLSGRERRILAAIERALELEDPELARRVAAINRIEAGGESSPRPFDERADVHPQPAGERIRWWISDHRWTVVAGVVLAIVLLVLAVLTA
ncbi:DUF3040 domain-containing protein [Nonomuraea sp. NN258]|uniref:DUF3040 domain-containing protein n=1 Tax=Nonomuraea antri TaxID=2730852 RepID=UPI001569EB3C|nr:DUF3040 domain-containing protein [Nonomuraea antri]NRQ38395.1 DUF3040 domain-containing protein [Nonomuraea antri]